MLYLGEIGDGQHDDWSRAIEAFDEDAQRHTQLSFFSADRELSGHAEGQGVQVRLDRMELHRPRQWGACWLLCQLYEQLELDQFWARYLRPSREGTNWCDILQTLVCYRLIDPGSEWRLHRQWFEQSAMGDLLGAARQALAGGTRGCRGQAADAGSRDLRLCAEPCPYPQGACHAPAQAQMALHG